LNTIKQKIADNMFIKMVLYFLGTSAIVSLFSLLIIARDPVYDGIVLRLQDNGVSHNEILAIQISVTFIVVSVVTAFSQKNDLIYWEDAMRYKMEKPVFTNFCALSSYLLADLLFSLIFAISGLDYVYFTFLLSLIVLYILTYRMIGAFFMHDTIKKQLEKDYIKAKDHRRTSVRYRDLYREYKRKTMQNTIKAIEERDIETVCENMSFLFRQNESDDAKFLVNCIVDGQLFYMLSCVVKECRFIFEEESYITYFFGICESITNGSTVKFVKSIVRSMGESIICDTDNNDVIRDFYATELNRCLDKLKNDGFNYISDEIELNYKKQLDGYYVKPQRNDSCP